MPHPFFTRMAYPVHMNNQTNYVWTAVVTGCGATIAQARAQAYRHAAQVTCPTLRYRLDIGDKLVGGDFERFSAETLTRSA